MSLKKALLAACLLILPGVVLRVAPYLDRAVQRPVREAPAPQGAAERSPGTGLHSIPSRLSERPLPLLVAGFTVEVGIYVSAMTVLLRSRWLVALLEAVSPIQKGVRAVFFAALLAGFLGGSQDTFPFVAWRMYSGIAEQPPSAYLVDGMTRSGASVRVDLGEVFSILGRYRGYNAVVSRIASIDAVGDEAELATALRTSARLYNLQHPADPVVHLSVRRVTIPLDNHEPPWMRDERVVAAIEVQ